MVNTEYILKKVNPFLVNNQLYKEDFKSLFNNLNKDQLKDVLVILKRNNIEILLDRKVSEKKNTTIDYKSLSKLSNEQLCILYKQGNEKVLDTIIEKNKKLIWSRVRKYSGYLNHKLEDEDLFQSGVMGLITAIRRFENDKGANLTTYSVLWIDQKIRRDIIDYGFTIRIPVHMADMVIKVNSIVSRNENIPKEELFKIMEGENISLENFELAMYLRNYLLTPSSVNSLIGEDGDSELINFIEDTESIEVEEEVEQIILKETIKDILQTLSEREQKVLILRFGLNGGQAMTLEEVGKVFGVTRERIRQIEAKALRKLRHPSRSKKIKNFLVEV